VLLLLPPPKEVIILPLSVSRIIQKVVDELSMKYDEIFCRGGMCNWQRTDFGGDA